jgi:hypothetical protein
MSELNHRQLRCLSRASLLSFTNLTEGRPPPHSNRLIRQDKRVKNPVFPKYKQKRAIFSLGDLNLQLTPSLIKLRSTVDPGPPPLKVITPANVKIYIFERNADHIP